MAATASRVERWLLVEQCGPWGPPTLPLARMAPALGRHLIQAAADAQARLVLLRHPAGVECPPGRRVYAVDSRPGQERLLHRHFAGDDALLSVDLGVDLTAADSWPPGWDRLEGPLLLVCTHGRHDRCCAVRGRPVAQALAAAWSEQTWECSHIGGDRFAANLVVLPAGYYLGRLTPPEAVEAVRALTAGRVPVTAMRGRSSLPLPVQAAQHFARTSLGRDRLDDLQPLGQSGAGDDAWVVQLAGSAGRPEVRVRVRYDRAVDPVRLTCQAVQAQPAPTFRCERIT